MNKVLSRVRQYGMSLVIRANQNKEPDMIVGAGKVMELSRLIRQEKINKVLIVTTSGMIKRGTLEQLFSELEKAKIEKAVYCDVIPDPTIECVENGVKMYHKEACEGIVAVGGGSVIDCSKIIGARVVKTNRSIPQMRGTLKINRKLPPFFAVPTTAGTGSEATAAAVITDTIDGVHYKYPINDLCLIPRYAILDPQLILGLPGHTTAITGIDALTHSVEAYINHFASEKTQVSAQKSVQYIMKNIEEAVENGQNMVAREEMLLGAYYGGIAITNNFVGYIHAIAHAVGALYEIPHGEANAIIMPVALRHYGEAIEAKITELAHIAGIKGKSNHECSEAFIRELYRLNAKFGIPNYISGLKEVDYETIVARALKEANPEYPVPVIWGHDDIISVLKELTK